MKDESAKPGYQKRRSLTLGSDATLSIIHLVLIACFLVSALALIVAWIAGSTAESLKTPALISGLSGILLVVTINKGGAAATLCILITGILVAPTGYLLRIAHMISRPETPFGDYARKYEGESPVRPGSYEQVVKDVLSILEERGVKLDPSTATALATVADQERIRSSADLVQANDAGIPLQRVVIGGEILREFVSRYRDFDPFQQDMAFLRSKGLITFEGTEYESAKPTEHGRRVADWLGGSSSLLMEALLEADSPVEDLPKATGIPSLDV
ncbi:MAG: hypothetical protein ACYS29_01860, partial [Planctomycetota bacterium]